MRQIDTSSLSNQNISSYLLAHTYTADADRAIFARVHIDQVAGNGDYSIYATIQAGGAGAAYMEGPLTTFAVPSGQTSIGFVSILIPVNNGDVVKFYVKGLAGDTTTPDIITRVFELTYLRPTTAGRTLDVDANGGAEIGAIQTDALSAAAVSAAAVTKIQSGLSTLTAGAQMDLVAEPNPIAVAVIQAGLSVLTPTGVLAALGMASSNLDAQLATLASYIDTEVAAIKAKTDNLPLDPADQSALAALIDAVAADVIAGIVSVFSQLNVTIEGGNRTVVRGDTWSLAFTDLGDLSTVADIWLTVKADPGQLDAASMLKIQKTIGLETWNGASTGLTAANASITITDAADGDILVTVKPVQTVEAMIGAYYYDVQLKLADGTIVSPANATGRWFVNADVTREV
jgi:hypothetical protein